jgi:hypothetical protein
VPCRGNRGDGRGKRVKIEDFAGNSGKLWGKQVDNRRFQERMMGSVKKPVFSFFTEVLNYLTMGRIDY